MTLEYIKKHWGRILSVFIPSLLILIVLLHIFPSNNFMVSPNNLSIAFNVSDQNREQIESLSIKNLGRSIENVRLSVKGSPESIKDLNIYITNFNQLEGDLKCIEENISKLSIIKKMQAPNESMNQSIKEDLLNLETNAIELRSTSNKMKAEINELQFAKSNLILSKSEEYIKLINSTLMNISSNISKLSDSVYQSTSPLNSSLNTFEENIINIPQNFSIEILNAAGRNITNDSKEASLNLDKLNPDQNYIFISLVPPLIEKINETETTFASIKMIFSHNTKIGNYRADIVMLKDGTEEIARIPMMIDVVSKQS